MERERDEWEEARTLSTVHQDRLLRLEELEKSLKDSEELVAQLRLAVGNKIYLEERVQDLELKQAATSTQEKEYIELKVGTFCFYYKLN